MDIITPSVRIKGSSNPTAAIIQALCNFGTPENPREPPADEKRAALRLVLDELAAMTAETQLPDSIIYNGKKAQFALWRQALKRLGLTDPDTTVIPEPPVVEPADIRPEAADTVQAGARTSAQNIPGWASWPQATAEAWYNTNIVTPLNASLPATISAATNRAIIVALIGIMKDMGVMLWAIARMVIAIRNKEWPELEQ